VRIKPPSFGNSTWTLVTFTIGAFEIWILGI
jgi:hypothetical protein